MSCPYFEALPISKEFITVKSKTYPNSLKVCNMILIVFELSWLIKFLTFSKNIILGFLFFYNSNNIKK